jgi:hypothetical protein
MLLCLNSTELVARGERTPPQDGDSVPATAAASAEAPAAADEPAEAGNTATVSPLQALVQDIMQQQKQRAQVGANPLSVIGPPKVLVSLCHPLNPISLSELTQGTATSGNVGLPCGHASSCGQVAAAIIIGQSDGKKTLQEICRSRHVLVADWVPHGCVTAQESALAKLPSGLSRVERRGGDRQAALASDEEAFPAPAPAPGRKRMPRMMGLNRCPDTFCTRVREV